MNAAANDQSAPPLLTTIQLVYVGTCQLQGGKTGELWATAEAAERATDLDGLRAVASPFAKDRKSYTVGAVYETPATLDDGGKPSTIRRKAGTYRRMLDTNPVAAAALREKGIEAADAAAKAEAKARAAGPADDLLHQVARIVAAAPFEMQERVIAGFAAEVRKRALNLWREQARRK